MPVSHPIAGLLAVVLRHGGLLDAAVAAPESALAYFGVLPEVFILMVSARLIDALYLPLVLKKPHFKPDELQRAGLRRAIVLPLGYGYRYGPLWTL